MISVTQHNLSLSTSGEKIPMHDRCRFPTFVAAPPEEIKQEDHDGPISLT